VDVVVYAEGGGTLLNAGAKKKPFEPRLLIAPLLCGALASGAFVRQIIAGVG